MRFRLGRFFMGGKAALRVVFTPAVDGPGDRVLRDRLASNGHTVRNDTDASTPIDATADLVIQSSNGSLDPSRLTSLLKPVGVTSKPKLKITIALAATDVDFETTDFLRLLVDKDGDGPAGFVPLVKFAAPDNGLRFLTDGRTRLGVVFQDVTYPLPADSTQLVLRIESLSTSSNEIVAFDNIRITSGDACVRPNLVVSRDAASIQVEFTGVLQGAPSAEGPFTDFPGNPPSPLILPASSLLNHWYLRAVCRE